MTTPPRVNAVRILAGSVAALLAMSSAHAANYYWDTNGTTPGLGDIAGTWGSSALFRTIGAADGRAVIDGTLSATSDINGTGSDTFYFGTVNLALGATASTIAIDATNVTANRIVFGAGQGSQGVTFSGGGGKITLATAFAHIVANNTGTNTIGAVIDGTVGMAMYGPGTVLLTGTNTFIGGLVVRNGGTLQVGNGTSGSLTSQALSFNNGGGVLNVRSLNAGSTQAMGALTFSTTGIGESTVQSTYGSSGNAELSFTSLAARGAGAAGNFVVSGGSNGSTNKIVLTGAATGFLDKGLFFGGSSYAAYDATGYVRGLIYDGGTPDANTEVSDTITASRHVRLTASPAARTGDTLLSLNLSGGGVNYTMNAGSLTVPAILKSGGGAVSTISGGTSLTTAANAELVIRTDTSSDLLTISSAVTGFSGGLTKSGAGTLTLSGTNGYTGTTNINAGTLALSGGSAIANGNTVVLANAAGATLQLDNSETINNLTGGGFSGGNVNVQSNTLTLATSSGTFGGTFTGTGGVIKQGAGTLTLSNKNTFAGTITVEGGALSLTYGNEATSSALALSSGGAINLAGSTTLNFTPGANLLVGNLSGQLIVGSGWTVGNDIKVTSGTANITFGVGNDNRWTFNGGVSGSSTPATNTTLAITTSSTSGDRQAVTFTGVMQDGSGGTLGLNLTAQAAAAGAFVNLTNSNTFSGAISLNTTAAANGFLVIGGTRNGSGLTTGSGSLGTGGIYSNTISLTDTAAGVSILNYASSANQTLGGVISGTDGQLQKDGSGTLTLSAANTYTGATTVNAGTLDVTGSLTGTMAVNVNSGTLLLSAAAGEQVNNSAATTLGGGTLGFNNAANQIETLGTLTLSANSIIDFGLGGGNDTFSFSGLGTHTGSTTLTINNWMGNTAGGVNGTDDRLFFTGSFTAFTSAFAQADVSFTGFGTGYQAINFGGTSYEIVPVPEPSGVLVALGMFGLAGWRERRKTSARLREGRAQFAGSTLA